MDQMMSTTGVSYAPVEEDYAETGDFRPFISSLEDSAPHFDTYAPPEPQTYNFAEDRLPYTEPESIFIKSLLRNTDAAAFVGYEFFDRNRPVETTDYECLLGDEIISLPITQYVSTFKGQLTEGGYSWVDCPDEDDCDAVRAQISCIGHKFGTKDEDSEEYWKEIEEFLWVGSVPERCLGDEEERRRFLGNCGRYFVDDDRLWLKGMKGALPRVVIIDVDGRKERVHEAHNHCGHRGRDPTYEHLRDRYWWPNMYDMVAYHTRQCSNCQRNARLKPIVPYNNASVPTLLRHFHLRMIRMPDGHGGKRYIVQAIDSLSGWPEAEAQARSSGLNTAKFIYKRIISRFSCIPLFTVERDFEFAEAEEILRAKFRVVVVFASPQHPNENAVVERAQRVLVDGVLKACERVRSKWPLYLDAVLWAIRTMTSRTTGYSPCFMLYGTHFIFSFDHDDATWEILEWDKIQDTPSLIGIRARQIARRDEVALQCSYHPRATRSRAIEDFHVIFRGESTCTDLEVGMWILRNDEADTWGWSGPFIIHEKCPLDDGYVLRELDGTVIRGYVSVHRLKLFYYRADRHILRSVSPSHLDFVTRFPKERREELRAFEERYVKHASVDPLCDGPIAHLLPIVTDVVGDVHYPTNLELRAADTIR